MSKAGIKPGDARRVFEHLATLETDDCVIYPRSLNSKGYGLISIDGKVRTTHTVICERHNGPRPPGLQAAHRCGVKACLNYRHIRWATPRENEADKIAQGTKAVGARNGNWRGGVWPRGQEFVA